MKKFDRFKTIELFIFIILAAIGLVVIFTNKELYHMIAVNSSVRILCILLWAAFVVSFLCIFLDFHLFSNFKKDFSELDFAVHSDPVSGLANRYSCDAFIEKYIDRPLPPDVGCIMFELTNIQQINQEYGHVRGNELIREFSSILQTTSINLCFVGRNGGNKFIALFEDCDYTKLQSFLDRVRQKVDTHNELPNAKPIEYKYGTAFEETDDISGITELIALANRRIYEE